MFCLYAGVCVPIGRDAGIRSPVGAVLGVIGCVHYCGFVGTALLILFAVLCAVFGTALVCLSCVNCG